MIAHQIFWLLILAIPIACVVRTVILEEIFREPREFCIKNSQTSGTILQRKFFYVFTCEYCFSHWVTIGFLIMTRFKLLILDDWRGYVIALFALVFVANVYLNLYARLRLDIQQVKAETEEKEQKSQSTDA